MRATQYRAIVDIDRSACEGCGDCLSHCPQGAIELRQGRAALRAEEACDGLGTCVGICPVGAIQLERRHAATFAAQIGGDGRAKEDLLKHRLAVCCRASECGRVCRRLVKQPGKSGVWCVDPGSLERVRLYEALASPEFHCPEGRF